ncbi:MAG TPA: right-handed parallel beta-helix repeat-containing protein [Syntrophales bacterium]|nr:right-handed parallel beta-helix repeat-containing protein [Syntrophales bacterium]
MTYSFRIACFNLSRNNYLIIFSIIIPLIHAILFTPVIVHAGEAKTKLNLTKLTKHVNGQHIIHLPPGLYQISETIILPSDTMLEGAGPDTILKATSPFFGQQFITSSNGGNDCRNIRLRSFKVVFDIPIQRGDLSGIIRFENVDHLEINNISMTLDTNYYGIDLSANIQNAIIENNVIENRGQGGSIMVRNKNQKPNMESRNITIRNNTLKSNNDEPLAVFGWMGSVENITIKGNNIQCEGSSFGISAFGIDASGHTGKLRDVTIHNNMIDGGTHGAIGIKGGAINIMVADNKIIHATGDGIFIHTGGFGLPKARGVLVKNNEIRKIGRHGIFAAGSEIRITKNRISNTKCSGVYVHGTVVVTDNEIIDTKPCILADGNHKKIIKRNKCFNSPIRILNKKGSEI